MKYGLPVTPECSQGADDMTTGVPFGASARSLEVLSWDGSLVRSTNRVRSGRTGGLDELKLSQRGTHGRQPVERKARRVFSLVPVTATLMASPRGDANDVHGGRGVVATRGKFRGLGA